MVFFSAWDSCVAVVVFAIAIQSAAATPCFGGNRQCFILLHTNGTQSRGCTMQDTKLAAVILQFCQ